MMITLENDKLVSYIMLAFEVDILNIELRLVLFYNFMLDSVVSLMLKVI